MREQGNRMRIFCTMVILCLGLASAAIAVVARDAPLVGRAQAYAETVATSSAATYVTLRTLNAFLSTAQEIEVGGSLFVSGNVQPLKVLEPIDDTVERVAGAIFAIMAATGIVAVALGPLGTGGWMLLALGCGVAVAELSLGRRAALSRPLLGYGAFLAVALPLAFVIAAGVADALTDAVWVRHQAIIADITRGIAEPAGLDDARGEGWIATMGDSLGSIADYRTFAVGIYNRADDLVASFVMILAVFVFKLFVLPIVVLAAFVLAWRQAAQSY
ncbi:hypothetical protein [Palleronia sp. LCG004]|uniref:hypothetical protein n=1 Tax=Palleronia sp. LCG004 TaxID=3079304 RepID=UPI002942D112|nr:hypothetical protein [Palleronia sp. LCG004]WOI55521.1 hypothetical protein RVY76_10760 [Palleronia sp. LCG004]